VPDLIETGLVSKIEVIQIGVHNYGSVGLGKRAIELCDMHASLSKTHQLLDWVPFGWERWVKL